MFSTNAYIYDLQRNSQVFDELEPPPQEDEDEAEEAPIFER